VEGYVGSCEAIACGVRAIAADVGDGLAGVPDAWVVQAEPDRCSGRDVFSYGRGQGVDSVEDNRADLAVRVADLGGSAPLQSRLGPGLRSARAPGRDPCYEAFNRMGIRFAVDG